MVTVANSKENLRNPLDLWLEAWCHVFLLTLVSVKVCLDASEETVWFWCEVRFLFYVYQICGRTNMLYSLTNVIYVGDRCLIKYSDGNWVYQLEVNLWMLVIIFTYTYYFIAHLTAVHVYLML